MNRFPLIDIVPRLKRMLSEPQRLNTALWFNAVTGMVEGLALAALLPGISSLATGQPVWGLGIGGWLLVLAALAAISFVLYFVGQKRTYAVALDFLYSIHRLVGDQVAKQPLGWFARPLAGKLSRMVSSELMSAGEIFAHMLGPLVSRIVSALVILVAAWLWNPLLGLVLTVSVPVFVLITLASTHFMRRGSAMTEPEQVNLSNRIVEYAQCQGALRSCGRSGDYAPLQDALADTKASKQRAQWIESLGLLLSGAVTQGVIVALISVAGSLAISGTLQPVPAMAFIGLALRFTSTLSTITEGAMALESRRPMLDAIDEVLTAQALPEPVEATDLPRPGEIEFENVTFGYSAETGPVLSDVSLRVPAGSMTALVGPSGGGKTTVARLVSRFYDTDQGVVRVGGAPVTEQTSAQLMDQLSMVFQDVYLFDDTLEENIRVGRKNATHEEVMRAADLAGVTEIAKRLPAGWNTAVREGGRALSGGERQRVASARALLKGSPIVLLDEATSALDVENESNVMAAVEELRKHSTVLIIAHRLDTIAAADQIIAMTDDGRVESQGTHDELLAAGGTYARFWEKLHEAQGWRLTPAG